MKVAVTGADGQLGNVLCQKLGPTASPLLFPAFDLTDRDAAANRLMALRPDAVINTAAYTQVDRAEEDRELCNQVNCVAVEMIAEVCRQLDCPLVQISTDYVFCRARGSTPFRETVTPLPAGVYALSKLGGEQHATQCPKHFVLRTCGLYASGGACPIKGRNFVDTMLVLGREREQLSVVTDQQCTPTAATDLADAILFLLTTSAYGTYHVTNRGATNWFEFALEIFKQAEFKVKLTPISTDNYGAAAPRPAYSVLDTSKYHALGGPVMPTWQQAVGNYVRELAWRSEAALFTMKRPTNGPESPQT